MNEASVTLNAIEEARARLKGLVHETPLDMSHTITTLADRETYLKLENLQRTGSFKIRGASNCIMTLSPEQKSAESLQPLPATMPRALPSAGP